MRLKGSPKSVGERSMISFGRFRLDAANQRLYCGSAETAISSKAAAILECLGKHPNELVTHDELLDAVWRGVHVQPEVLKVYIAELRRALRDTAEKPRYIETVHRRGYRLIWPSKGSRASSLNKSEPFIGRASQMAALHKLLRKAEGGHRQIVFITGDVGIGKTALLKAFFRRVERRTGICVVQGQVAHSSGDAEPFSPIRSALRNLPEGEHCERFMAAFRNNGPCWLPFLTGPEETARTSTEPARATSQQMIREFAEAIESYCGDTLMVLGLDDLHRADSSTLDLLEYVASLTRPAKLLIVAAVDDVSGSERVRSIIVPLHARRCCEEIRLAALSQDGLRRFLNVRYPSSNAGDVLTAPLYRLSGGVPLFFCSALHYMEAQGWILRTDCGWVLCTGAVRLEELVPPDLTGLVDLKLRQLPPEDQRVLEAGSIVGIEFTPDLAAHAVDAAAGAVEKACTTIVKQGGWLQSAGFTPVPGGASVPRFRFLHELYREILYCRQPAAERVQRHRRVADALERASAHRIQRPLSELELHSVPGPACSQGIQYLLTAAGMASHRHAGTEAAALLSEALKLAGRLPRTARIASELRILDDLGAAYLICGQFHHCSRAWHQAASKAMKHGRVDLAMRAISRLVFPVGWENPIRLRSAADRVIADVHKIENPVIRAEVTIRALALRNIGGAENIDDSAKAAGSLQTILDDGDSARIASARIQHALFQLRHAAYQDVITNLEESMPIALRHDPIDVVRGEWAFAWALLHAGQWGRMQSVAMAAASHAQKNGNSRIEALFTGQLAWLHAEAGAYDSAQALCRHAFELSGNASRGVGVVMCHVILAMSAVGLHDADAALAEVKLALDASPRTQYFWRTLAEISALQVDLMKRDFSEIRQGARRLSQLAAKISEKTWKAVALSTCALAAAKDDQYSLARRYLDAALQLVDGSELPLAKWRVEAMAAEILDRSGASERATQLRDRSTKSRQSLFNSLGSQDPLRRLGRARL